MLPGLLLSIFFWAIHQFINADVKDLCENIQLNVFDHPLAAFNALYYVDFNESISIDLLLFYRAAHLKKRQKNPQKPLVQYL